MFFDRARLRLNQVGLSLAIAVLATPAFAAGSNMPWDPPLNQILQAVQRPVAKVVSVIIVVISGLTLAFGPQYDLCDAEWRIVEPLRPLSGRGAARVDDQRVVNSISYVVRTGSPRRDLLCAVGALGPVSFG